MNTPEISPMVSICCVTYNHEKYIRQCLDGFVMQKTSFPFEILVHEDASTDNTAIIVKEFENRYPHLFRCVYQTVNQHAKLNPLIKILLPMACGKYIALCEGDDYWTDPMKLQKQVDFLEVNPDYVIGYHDSMVVDENNNIINTSRLPDGNKRDFSQDELIKAFKIQPQTMCFRNVLKEIPDEYHRGFGGDKFLTSLLGHYGKGKYFADIKNSAFRIHSGGINSGEQDLNQRHRKYLSTRIALYQYYERIKMRQYSDYFLFNEIYPCVQKMVNSNNSSKSIDGLYKTLHVK